MMFKITKEMEERKAMLRKERKFFQELNTLLQEHCKNINIDDYWNFKNWYIFVEPILKKLRIKYNYSSNPTGINTTLILLKSSLKAKNEDKPKKDPKLLQMENDYLDFQKKLNKLFENNTQYITPEGNTIYYTYLPKSIIDNKIKKEIEKEYKLNQVSYSNKHSYNYVLKKIKNRFQ